MKIKKIRLSGNYKRFHDLTINLGDEPKKIIALVGPNGCGKSSVFDGMLFLNNSYAPIGDMGMKGIPFHSSVNSLITRDNIEIEFDNGESFRELLMKRAPYGENNTVLSFRNSYRYNSNLAITSLQAIPKIGANNNGASSSVDLDDKMTINYQRLYIYLDDYRKLNQLTDSEANEHVIGDLNRILMQCLGMEISDHGNILSGNGSLYFKKPHQQSTFSFNVLSSGEKEVVDILLDIYLKKDKFNDTIYIIDEPELHLNTSIQKKLLLEIEKLIPDNCQLWIATHSIGFLNALQKELSDKSEIIDFEGDYTSEPVTLIPMVKNRKNWQKIFKTALEDLTGLMAPEVIIYCEGRTDPGNGGEDQGLDAEIYNQIFSERYPGALFVSSGGSTEPQRYSEIALIVLNKAFKDVKILLLKDKDIHTDGTPTLDSEREEFIQKDPMSRRMLLRKEIENYLYDFEILNKAYGISKEDYHKIIGDINEDVKSKTGELIKFFGIKTGMNGNQFKIHLSTIISPDMLIYKELEDLIFLSNELKP
jgi:predicted ATPase